MYSHFGDGILDARKVFDEMSMRDVMSWDAMIAGYAKVGDVWNVMELFESMPERNVISWTSVIAGYAHADRPCKAIEIFRRMQFAGVNPDEVVMLVVLSACSQLGAFEFGIWVHDYIGKNGLCKTLPLNNALIDMYAKSGNMDKALEVFENMKQRCVVTWTTIIRGLAAHGLGREALDMFSRMERARIKPNDITFVAILSACSHVGFVREGQCFFRMMEARFGILPKVEHYGCMVDLLGRSGFLEEAEELVKKMPLKANAAIWGSLLAASRVHGDVVLAEKSLHHLIMLEPHNSGNYILLSNMYASQGRWDESGIVRKVMKDAGVRKVPGASSIEISKRFYEFTSGEKSHPQFEMVDKVLSHIAEERISSSEMSEELLVMLAFDAP